MASVSPLKRNGIEKLQFNPESPDHGETITKADAEAITTGRNELKEKEVETFEPQPMTVHLQVTRPDFDPDAKAWRFRYGDKTISVDISETSIADDVRARGLVRISQ